MKPLNLLLFTIATLGGFSKAVPFLTKPEKRIGNAGDPFPVHTTQSLSPQATSYQFYRSANWNNDADVKKDQPAQNVLNKINNNCLFTAVVLTSARSSVVGLKTGLITPTDYINGNDPGTALITSGAFFIMGRDKALIADFNNGVKGKPLPPEQYKGFSVGPTSLTKNIVDVPSVVKDLYVTYTADDGTYITSGPDLRKRIDVPIAPQSQVNTNAGRLTYWIYGDDGKPIVPKTKSQFVHLPGGVVTSNERNERSVVVIVNDSTKIVCAYTGPKAFGKTINEMSDLISVFMQNYLDGKKIETTQLALNLDGGGTTYIAWVNNGKTDVLAVGNSNVNPTQRPLDWQPRKLTTMLKYAWLDGC